MNQPVLLGLIQNVGLLALLVVVYAGSAEPLARLPGMARQLAYGLGFGLAGLGLMSLPIEFSPGLIFDGRVVPMLLAGPFGGGPLAAATAVGLVTGGRLWLGGPGALPSVFVSLAVLGLSTWLWRRRRRGGRFDASTLALAGAANALALCAALFLLGRGTALEIIRGVGPGYLLISTLGPALFGQLLLLDDRRRAALHAAEQASRAKSRFLARMSHEFRTPLTGVLGMLDLMRDADLPAVYRSYLGAMRDSSRGLLRLVEEILDFSDLEAGRLTLSPTAVDPRRLGFDLVARFEEAAVAGGVELALGIGEEVPDLIRCDRRRLDQLLHHLVAHALAGGRGRVELSLSLREAPDGPRLCFEVEGGADGVEAERLEQLFEPFAFEEATAAGSADAGLGLAVARQLAGLMGGSLTAAGAGLRFTLLLPHEPVAAPAASPAAAPQGAAIQRPASQGPASHGPGAMGPLLAGLEILVAEDAPVTRLLLGEMLKKLGARTLLVEQGAAAVAAVEEHAFDAVVMDMQMPELDGMEATRRIRALGGVFERLPIVGLTADAQPESRPRYLGAGLDALLTKPVDWAELVAVLTALRPDRPNLLAAPSDSLGGGARAGEIEGLIREVRAGHPRFDPAARRELAGALGAERFREIAGLWPVAARQHLEQVRGAVEAADRGALIRAAHAIKGTAGHLGFRQLEALCLLAQTVSLDPAGERRLGEAICFALESSLEPPGDGAAGPLRAAG